MSRILAGCVLALAVLSGVGQAWGQELTITVTHYALGGTTYSGQPVGPGVGACSWNIPLYATVRFPDGREYRCLDRGSGLGSVGWLDIWVPSVDEARRLGRYTATVEISR